MGVEIERKFLVKGDDYKAEAVRSFFIKQAYLSPDPSRIVRIRISEERAFLAVKTSKQGESISRSEWEYEIPLTDGIGIFKICATGTIEKTRYIVPSAEHFFEVDEFHGRHEGLVIAEIELGSEDEEFEKPHWLGEEVTSDPAYYNSNLAS